MELKPQSLDAPFNLGTVRLAQQAYQDAIELLEPLASQDVPHDGAAFNLAQAYRGVGRSEDAIKVLESLIERSPDYPESGFTLGLLREEQGDLPGAEQAYRKEIELRPDFVSAYLNLAVLLEKMKRPEEALEVLNKALALELPDEQVQGIQEAIAALEDRLKS